MRPSNVQSPVGETPNSANAGLRCPQCEYNLTGLAENRCPECGTPFDPEALLAAMEGAIRPIPGWDDPGESPVRRLLSVCQMTMFEPAKFARRFPLYCSPDSVRDFWWCARVAALGPTVVVGLIPILFTMLLSGILFVAITIACFLASALACEALVVFMLDALAKPKTAAHPKAWSHLVTMFGGFLCLNTNACVGAAIVAGFVAPSGHYWWLIGVAEVGIVCWWWYALGRGIAARGQHDSGLWVAILMIPVAFLLAAVVPLACFAAIG